MRFQSENAVFNYLWPSVNGVLIRSGYRLKNSGSSRKRVLSKFYVAVCGLSGRESSRIFICFSLFTD